MKQNIILNTIFLVLIVFLFCFYFSADALAQTCNINVETKSATNINNSQATLNGNIPSFNSTYCGTTYAWFQWGATTSYGYESARRIMGNAGLFDQHVAELVANIAYHFRAVAQNNSGTIYGQDMTFSSVGIGTAQVQQILQTGTGLVAGATAITSGLTNNFFTDSFFLPLFLIILGSWLYFSGRIYKFADWLKTKKN